MEEISTNHKYIQTWLKNRYAEFFTMLLCNTEPKTINSSMSVDTILKLKYLKTSAEIFIIGKMIEDGTASDEQKKLFFTIKELKTYAIEYNKTLQKNFNKIYDEHYKLGTPLEGIFFHIYCFLKFTNKFKSVDHDFGKLLSYTLTSNEAIKDEQMQKIEANRIPTRAPKTNTTKTKSKWLDICKKHGYTIHKRKYNLFPNQSKTRDKK